MNLLRAVEVMYKSLMIGLFLIMIVVFYVNLCQFIKSEDKKVINKIF